MSFQDRAGVPVPAAALLILSALLRPAADQPDQRHPTAVLTSRCLAVGSAAPVAGEPRIEDAHDMVEVMLERHPLVATAGLAWRTDLPRRLQQLLFDTADGVDGIRLARAS